MNKKSKIIISLLLTVTIAVSVFSVLSFSSMAAENSPANSAVTIPPRPTTEPVPTTAQPTTEQPTTEKPTQTPTPVPTQPPTDPIPKPAKVKNIVKTSAEATSITLKWDKVSGATGYYVYYCNVDKKHNYSKVATVTTNTATIKKLCHTTRYNFKVSAYIVKNGKTYEGTATVKKTATQPAAISGLKRVHSSDVIELKWNRNTLATGYKIYRFVSGKSSDYTLVKTIKGNSTVNYVDKSVKVGTAYYYKVKAYREITNEYKATYNGYGSIIRFMSGLTPVNAKFTTQINRVSFTWKKNKYATGYEISYATSKNGSYTVLGTTAKDFWNTKKLSANKSYYFRIIPYRIHSHKKYRINGTYNTLYITVSPNAFGHSIGGTYAEISIKQQHMWYYKNGKQIVSTDVVTGNADGVHNTPTGYYTIWQRSSPATLVGPGYSSYVSYWMAFNGGIGIHDASWRSDSEYGGTTYQGNGSHGCVNTPYKNAKIIYQNSGYGTPVIVF